MRVAKLSGRGLGFAGGTLDKLESIPGFRSDLTPTEFYSQLKSIGLVVSGQSPELAPADGKLYALRDVTATVDSPPLIASSIMSKKIATGANGIVLDVKVDHGAFIKTEADAFNLASSMVGIGHGVGRKARAVISDMEQPLGRAVGNALALKEALDTLHGQGSADFRQHCLAIASQMMLLSGEIQDEPEVVALLEDHLDSGKALVKSRERISAQGGDTRYVDDPQRSPTASFMREVPAPRSVYVASLDAREVGLTSMLLAGGRAKKGDSVDPAVAVVLQAKIGDSVQQGQPPLTLHAKDEAKLSAPRQRLLAAYRRSEEPVEPPPLVHRIVV